jgi:hypothetical protein
MSRSSTFSSRALLLAAVVLVAVELGLARTSWIWSRDPSSASGVFDAMERLIIAPALPPTVVFMGSSRARDAMAPRRLEQDLGLPPGSVLNLGMTGGAPLDAWMLYRRNRAKLSSARVLVFAVEEWHVNRSFPPGVLDRRLAPLRERIGVFDHDATMSLVAGWFWRTYDAQEPLRDLITTTLSRRALTLRVTDDGRIVYREHEEQEGPAHTEVAMWATSFYRGFAPSAGRIRQIQSLIDDARADGMAVLVVRLPWRDAYVDEARRSYPREFAEATSTVGRLQRARVVLYERASAAGIPERSFHDYGHLTLRGAELMTDLLARDIAKALPEARR